MSLGNLLGGLAQQALSGQGNDGLQNMLGSLLGNQANNPMLSAIMPMILNWVQQQGGAEQALSQLQALGIGNGNGSPLDAVQNLFSQQDVQQVAEQANTSTEQVYDTLAQTLPNVVQQMNSSGLDVQQLSGLASSLFKR